MKAKFLFSISLFFSLLLINNVEAATITLDPVGTYEFVVSDIPDQPDIKGTMVVSKDGNDIKVLLSSGVAGEIALSDAKLDGNELTGKFEAQGIIIKLKGTFSPNGFEGQLDTEVGIMGVTATKK